jgi:hypothetical protein
MGGDSSDCRAHRKQHASQPRGNSFCRAQALYPLYGPRMNKPPVFLATSGALALAGVLLLAPHSSGQAVAGGDPVLTQLLIDVTAQQIVIAENHTKIDEKLAGISEDVRVARIFVGRGGGKTK